MATEIVRQTVSVEEAAEMLGISKNQAYKAVPHTAPT